MVSFSRFVASSRLKSSKSSMRIGLVLEGLERRDCPASIPLLEVPGITGTLPSDFNFTKPTSPLNSLVMEGWLSSRGTQPDKLVLVPGVYDPLVSYLQANNYESDPGLISQVPYDWRLPLAPEDGIIDGKITGVTASEIAKTDGDIFTTCLDYLGYSLRKVAESWLATNPGNPLTEIDVVAHSMGNLVTRAYVQSSAYGGTFTSTTGDLIPLPKIRNFVQMAPPNSGSSMAFPVWMGDDKILVVPPGDGYAEATSFPSTGNSRNVLLYMLRTQYAFVAAGGTIDGPVPITRDSILVNGSPNPVEFIRRYCPTIGVLVPTYDFVQNSGGSISGVQNNPTYAVPSIIYDLNQGGGAVDLPPLVENYNLVYGTAVTTVDLAVNEVAPSGTWYPLTDSHVPLIGGNSLANVPNGNTFYNMTAQPNNGDGIVPLISFTNVVPHNYLTQYPQNDPSITHVSVMTNTAVQTLVGQILENPSGSIDTNLVEVNRQVGNLFQTVLGRNPDPEGLKSWGGAIQSGKLTVSQAYERILHSTEHYGKAVTAYFQEILKRDPSPTGLGQFVEALRNGLTEKQLVAAIVASPEFQKNASDSEFVQNLYQTILGRTGDEGGIKDHLAALKQGVTRQALADSFLESQEHAEKVVDQIFETILGRAASVSGKEIWARYLEDSAKDDLDIVPIIGGSLEGVSHSRSYSFQDNVEQTNDLIPNFQSVSDSTGNGISNWKYQIGIIPFPVLG